MCGRYTLSLPLQDIALELDVDLPEFSLQARYNISPSQRVAVLTDEVPRAIHLHRWGLIPSWARDPSIGNKLLNARGETLASKPSFRDAYRKRRCLILADGFYEWKKTATGKVPHHIRMQDASLITLAGLWEVWTDAEGKEIRSVTIVTTEPNVLMAPIHNRMPVIVPADFRDQWLDHSRDIEDIQQLIRPLPDGELEAVAVSKRVNSPRNEGPELLEPPAATLFG